jgi:hypothetical protein
MGILRTFVQRRVPPPNRAGVVPQVNARVRVISTPGLEQDPPRNADIPSRPARMNLAMLGIGGHYEAVDEGRFVQGISPDYQHAASMPVGSHAPDDSRRNVKVPPHVAYGSLFS